MPGLRLHCYLNPRMHASLGLVQQFASVHSEAQWATLRHTYSFHEKCSWETFQTLSRDVQVEVSELLNHYRVMTQSAGKLSQMTKNMNPRGNQQQMLQQMSNAMPPQLMRQMQQMSGMGGGMGGMQELMKQMQSMGGLPGGMKF
jgi:hypothetical protein